MAPFRSSRERKLHAISLSQQCAAVLLLLRRRMSAVKKKRTHRFHVHPMNQLRRANGEFATKYDGLRENPDAFYDYLGITIHQFDFVLKRVTPHIEKKRVWREPISPEEHLFVTLRYLTSGLDMKKMAENFLLGHTTVWSIVTETCMAIILVLRDFTRVPQSAEDWEKVAEGFEKQRAMPHCCGALDGKHIMMRKPRKSGSTYFNYKRRFSHVLMALTDANCNFLYFDIGAVGSLGDAHVFRSSRLGKTVYKFCLIL